MISSKLNFGFGVTYTTEGEGMATGSAVASVRVTTPKRRDGGGGAFTTTGFGLEYASSGNMFFRKCAIAFIRVLRLILASPIF